MSRLMRISAASFSGAGSIRIAKVRWKMKAASCATTALVSAGRRPSGSVAAVARIVQTFRL